MSTQKYKRWTYSSDLIWLYRCNTAEIHQGLHKALTQSNPNPILVLVGCHLVPTKYIPASCQVRFICVLPTSKCPYCSVLQIILVFVSITPLRLCLLCCDATGSLNPDCRFRHICAEVTCVKIRMESDSDHLQRWFESFLDEIRTEICGCWGAYESPAVWRQQPSVCTSGIYQRGLMTAFQPLVTMAEGDNSPS